jgi:hypothetical protein
MQNYPPAARLHTVRNRLLNPSLRTKTIIDTPSSVPTGLRQYGSHYMRAMPPYTSIINGFPTQQDLATYRSWRH